MRRADLILATVGLIIFIAIAAFGMAKPGINAVEAQMVMGLPEPGIFKDGIVPSFQLFGHNYPLLLQQHIGCFVSWLYTPLLAFFPHNTVTIRTPAVTAGALAVVGCYMLGRLLFSAPVAGLATFLFAIDPNMIFNTRCDWGHTTIMNVAKVWSIYFLLLGLKSKSPIAFAASGLLIGIGLYDKLNFAWLVIAFGIALLATRFRELKELSVLNKAIFSIAVLIGAAPLILANVGTLTSFWAFFCVGPPMPIDIRWHMFLSTLGGTALHEVFNGLPPWVEPYHAFTGEPLAKTEQLIKSVSAIPRLTPAPTFLLLLLTSVVSLVTALKPRSETAKSNRDGIQMMLITTLLLAAISILTRATYSPTHYFFLYPFMQFIIAYALLLPFVEAVPQKLIARGTSVALFLWLTIASLLIDVGTWQEIDRYGGRSWWSDGVDELADFVNTHPNNQYVFLDVNMAKPIQYLTSLKCKMEEKFWPTLFAGEDEKEGKKTKEEKAALKMTQLEKDLLPLLNEEAQPIFVIRSDETTQFPVIVEAFKAMVKDKNLQEVELATIKQKDGLPLFRLIRLERKN